MEKIASIDIGSNAVRVTTAQLQSKNVILLKDRMRIPLRLGSEAFSNKSTFSPEFIKYAQHTFKEIHSSLIGMKIKRIRTVATSAFRDSKNSLQLKKAIKTSSGIDIQIISGDQEASFILKAIQTCTKFDTHSDYLLFDLGGGSLELSIIEKGKIIGSRSVNLGTVRLLEASKKFKTKEQVQKWMKPKIDLIHQFLDKELKGSKKLYVIGTGGNFRRISKLATVSQSRKLKFISPQHLIDISNSLSKTTYIERVQKFDLRPDRADVILPAIEVITKVLEGLPVLRLYTPNIGLDVGLLIEMSDGRTAFDQLL